MLDLALTRLALSRSQAVGEKNSAESTIRNLRGFKVYADKVTGSKEVRAEPFAAQVQGGKRLLCAGICQTDYLDEMVVVSEWQISRPSGCVLERRVQQFDLRPGLQSLFGGALD